MSDPVLPAYVKGLFHQLVKAVGGVEAAGAFLGVSHQRISQLQTTTCADTHCWHEHTDARLLWLYGEEGRAAREAATHADVAAWRALGTRRAA